MAVRQTTSCFLFIAIAAFVITIQSSGLAAEIDFNSDIRPILSSRCFACHGPDEAERMGGGEHGLRLDTDSGSLEDLGGYAAIVPGKPSESEVVARITSDDEYEIMPPPDAGDPLTAEQIELIVQWSREGGHYSRHWSYVAPTRPSLPKVADSTWPRNPIDYFVLDRLNDEELSPSPEADRYTLIRRVALDLTGLPPTVEEVDTFVMDRRLDGTTAFWHVV